MSELEILSQRVDMHVEQDHENFTAIRESLARIDEKLDILSAKTIRLEVIHDTAAKAGAASGSRWSAIIAVVVAGLFQACNWVSGVHGNTWP